MSIGLVVKKHVSQWCYAYISAYVCGERGGLILEEPYNFGDSLNGVSGLDIDAERTIVCDKLDELREQGATEREIKIAMKNLGISRFVTKIYKHATFPSFKSLLINIPKLIYLGISKFLFNTYISFN